LILEINWGNADDGSLCSQTLVYGSSILSLRNWGSYLAPPLKFGPGKCVEFPTCGSDPMPKVFQSLAPRLSLKSRLKHFAFP